MPTTAVNVGAYKATFSSADVGYIVMGIILFVACIICCLAAIGFNSKRRKRSRDQAAWEDVAEGRMSLDDQSSSDQISGLSNPIIVEGNHEEGFFESVFSGGGRRDDRMSATTTRSKVTITHSSTTSTAYKAVPIAEEDGATSSSMWPGATKKGGAGGNGRNESGVTRRQVSADENVVLSNSKGKPESGGKDDEGVVPPVAEASSSSLFSDIGSMLFATAQVDDGSGGAATLQHDASVATAAETHEEEFHF